MVNRDYIEKLNMFAVLNRHQNGSLNAACLLEMNGWFEKQINGRISERMMLDCLEKFFLSYPTDDERVLTSRERAREKLKCMVNYGYLEEEYKNQERYFLLSVYAYQIIGLIQKMDVNEEMEYSSNLLTLHGMFSNDFSRQFNESPYTVILKQAKRMTEEIENQLRILQASIKNRIIDTAQNISLQDLYEFLQQIHGEKSPFDKFLRLDQEFKAKRMEFFIPERISELQASDTFMDSAVAQCMETEGKEKEEAVREVNRILLYLKNAYSRELPSRIVTIQKTIREYYSKAALKAEIASGASQSTVNEQLKFIYSHMNDIEDDRPIDILSIKEIRHYDPLLYTYKSSTPKEKRHEEQSGFNEEEMNRLLLEEKKRQDQTGFEDINRKMFSLLSAKNPITDKDFVIDSDEDLLFLINASVYSTHEGRCYDITFEEDKTRSSFGEYSRFTITRRDANGK